MSKKNKTPEKNSTTDAAKGAYNSELSSHAVGKKQQLPEDGSFTIVNDEETEIPVNGDIADVDAAADSYTTSGRTNDDEIVMGTEADVTEEDLKLLGHMDEDMDLNDDEMTNKGGLDDTDEDGDLLNEGKSDIDTTGDELDIPGEDSKKAELNKALGEEDEENDYYSLDDEDVEKEQ
jgi:hypothetical protein